MKEIKAPNHYEWCARTVFLAGTIDMGNSIDWQQYAVERFRECDVQLLNPRRTDWDSSWEQTIGNPQFREQVEWELQGLDNSNVILMHFASGSQSPITLMELGLCANKRVVISCAPDFWRRGNIEVLVAQFPGLELYDNLDAAIDRIKAKLDEDY